MSEVPLKIGIVGNKDALKRIEPWLTKAMQEYMPARSFEIGSLDPFPPGQNNCEITAALKPDNPLDALHQLHFRAGTLARVMLERNKFVDVAIRIDSGALTMNTPRIPGVYFDGQFAVVGMLGTRLKGAGAIMLYGGMVSQGYLGISGVGHRQETKMSETAILGILPRWWMERERGVHITPLTEAA